MFSKLLLITLTFLTCTFTGSAGQVYITEEKVQIDRCACAWFITRFIDKAPTFIFIKQGDPVPEGISYDFFGAEYFHRGPDCSFTSFVKTHIKEKNQALIEINKTVNDVFAWQSGPNSLSVAIKQHIDVLADSGMTDAEVYQAILPVFDLLYLKKSGPMKSLLDTETCHRVETNILKLVYGPSLEIQETDQELLNNANLEHTIFVSYLEPEPETSSHVAVSLRQLALRVLAQ